MSYNILVVDDSKVIRDSLRVIFEAEGYKVDSAENGADALDKARENKYSGIITDVFMPVMDGYEFIKRVRGIDGYNSVPIIIITVEEEIRMHREKGLHAGANIYLAKPTEPKKLVTNMKMLLGESLER
ncbi:MAG: response regulator [Deltaproteobacteria bacterium]|uniref:Response regulator n=1 Tax=Candidatus Zymogenus saltonus TaxID=2844893 RepID=A0A9D8PN27_9DELT|nr:response regulator [Candidatus Zymogenus saltonus]